MASVTLSRLEKTYNPKGKDSFFAVKGIDLEIKDKEFMVLVGPSGCGKSTTLRMIAGLEEATGGSIHIGDRLVNDVPPKDRDIAMVFQNYALYPHMTVFQNMGFGLKLLKYPKSEIRTRVHAAAEILGLTSMLDRKPKALSGGQRQRVALGRAIVRQPKVFLFDEPLSNLDAKMRVQMRAEITKLHSRLDSTMIYVTHDQVEAMTMGTRICVMSDGNIMQVGEPLEIYRRPANIFVAEFIGSPPMNIFRGRLEDGGTPCFVAGGGALRWPLEEPWAVATRGLGGAEVALGVRPEDLVEIREAEAGGTPGFTAKVEAAEPMGAETLVYLRVGDQPFIARMASDHHYRIDSQVRVAIRPGKARLFNADSGAVLADG
jgi:multiple sugar transport system ATP-binding protein